jgi:hypothetical protein
VNLAEQGVPPSEYRRWAAFELLVAWRAERLGRRVYVEEGEMFMEEQILDGLSDEDVLSVSVEELAATIEEMAERADIVGGHDENGFGEAWVVPGVSFRGAREALRWRPFRTVRSRPRVRVFRPRRRAAASRRARSPSRPSGDDDPHDVVPRRRASIAAQRQVTGAKGRTA